MTFTAIRFEAGLGKSRDVPLCRVSQASRSISVLGRVPPVGFEEAYQRSQADTDQGPHSTHGGSGKAGETRSQAHRVCTTRKLLRPASRFRVAEHADCGRAFTHLGSEVASRARARCGTLFRFSTLLVG